MAIRVPQEIILSDFEHRTLLMLKDTCSRFKFDKIHPYNFLRQNRNGLDPVFLRGTFSSLTRKGLLYHTEFAPPEDSDAREEFWEFTPECAEYFDTVGKASVSNNKDELPKSGETKIPASDRFVSIDDNNLLRDETLHSLSKLSEVIKASNGLFASAEERLQVSREIDFVGELIQQPKIHIVAVWQSAKENKTLKWLMEQTVSGVVRTAASNAFEHLEKLIQTIFPH